MSATTELPRQVKHVRLRDGERPIAAWVAGIAYGEKSNATKVGGTLVLTDQRVIFEPLKLPKALIPGSDRRWIAGYFFDMELGGVRQVAIGERRRAAVVITGPDGSMALNVAASRMSMAWSKKNIAARDDAYERIRAAITDAT
jgi:hypothetical protein